MQILSHHRTQGAGAFWKTAGTTIKCNKNYGTGSGMVMSSSFPGPMLFSPLAGAAQATLQEGTGESPMPCDICANTLPPSWWLERTTGQRSKGPWAFVCVKNPLCLLSLAFSTEGHLSGLEFCLEESGREP